MKWIDYQAEDRLYLQNEAFCRTGLVRHGFTGRLGGVSHGKVTGLNLGFRVGDDPASVQENYRLLGADLGILPEQMVLSRQTHTDTIRPVTDADAGKGLTKESDITDTDGLITDRPSLALVIFTADCVPVLLLDPARRVIAAVHAGWRGTVKGIAGKAARMMQAQYGCAPADILAAIGPSIGPCCFEVGADTAGQFPPAYVQPKKDGKYLVDLWRMNADQLAAAGVCDAHIAVARQCTICRADRYYSYRVQKEQTGRQAAVIMLQEG